MHQQEIDYWMLHKHWKEYSWFIRTNLEGSPTYAVTWDRKYTPQKNMISYMLLFFFKVGITTMRPKGWVKVLAKRPDIIWVSSLEPTPASCRWTSVCMLHHAWHHTCTHTCTNKVTAVVDHVCVSLLINIQTHLKEHTKQGDDSRDAFKFSIIVI